MIHVIAVPHSNMKQKLVAEPEATNAPFIRTIFNMAFVAYFYVETIFLEAGFSRNSHSGPQTSCTDHIDVLSYVVRKRAVNVGTDWIRLPCP